MVCNHSCKAHTSIVSDSAIAFVATYCDDCNERTELYDIIKMLKDDDFRQKVLLLARNHSKTIQNNNHKDTHHS